MHEWIISYIFLRSYIILAHVFTCFLRVKFKIYMWNCLLHTSQVILVRGVCVYEGDRDRGEGTKILLLSSYLVLGIIYCLLFWLIFWQNEDGLARSKNESESSITMWSEEQTGKRVWREALEVRKKNRMIRGESELWQPEIHWVLCSSQPPKCSSFPHSCFLMHLGSLFTHWIKAGMLTNKIW